MRGEEENGWEDRRRLDSCCSAAHVMNMYLFINHYMRHPALLSTLPSIPGDRERERDADRRPHPLPLTAVLRTNREQERERSASGWAKAQAGWLAITANPAIKHISNWLSSGSTGQPSSSGAQEERGSGAGAPGKRISLFWFIFHMFCCERMPASLALSCACLLIRVPAKPGDRRIMNSMNEIMDPKLKDSLELQRHLILFPFCSRGSVLRWRERGVRFFS